MSAADAIKILIVDDLEENLVALEAVLRRPDLTILRAHSGEVALDTLLRHDVALALLDVQMPGMDGFELAELMRGSARSRHVPIIFVTAGAGDRQRIFQGYESGAVDFLLKPIEPTILRSKIETFVQLHRQRLDLQEHLRLNEMFMAVLGHDLRNPLNVISMAGDLLEIRGEPSNQLLARQLRSASGLMSRMISDLLDVVQIRRGTGMPIARRVIDMSEIVLRVVENSRLVHRDRVIEVDLSGDLRGAWDHDRIVQLLSNLVGNAIKHGRADTPVDVRAKPVGDDQLVLEVSNGGGISAELRGKVFDPFRSGKRTSSSEGIGLGLYIVQEIARAHGGFAELDASDQHTTLRVVLPRRAPDSGAVPR